MSRPLPNPERTWRPLPLPDADPRAIAEARPCGSFDSVRLLPGGRANLNLLLDRDRVLRVYRRDPGASEKERRLLERPWESFRVPEVLGGGRDFLLLEWIELSPVRDTAVHGEEVGFAAAEIHAVPFDSAGFLDADLQVVDSLPAARSYAASTIDGLGGPWTAYAEGVDRLLRAHAEDLSTAATVLNHGDFKASNLFVDPCGRLVVLDWEFAFSGPALFDLGQLFRWGASEEFREGFVRGYERGEGLLPDRWMERADALDLVNLLGLARGAGSDAARAGDLRLRLERTLSRR